MPIEIYINVFIPDEQKLQKLKYRYMLFEWENCEHACKIVPTGSVLLNLYYPAMLQD